MASNLWGDTQRLAQSAFNDVSNTYQQFLTGTTDPSRRNLNYEIAESTYDVNPEYGAADRAYTVQEQEKADMWKGYEQWRDAQPEYQQEPDIEP